MVNFDYPTMILPTGIGQVHLSFLGDNVVLAGNLSASGGKGYWSIGEVECSGHFMVDIIYSGPEAHPTVRPRFPLSLRDTVIDEEYGEPAVRSATTALLQDRITKCVLNNPRLNMEAEVVYSRDQLSDAEAAYAEVTEARNEARRKIVSLRKRQEHAAKRIMDWESMSR
jgi:hypothetical protein